MSIKNYIQKITNEQALTINQISNIVQTVISIFVQQSNVIQLTGEWYIVGDIHGQFYDLLKMINQSWSIQHKNIVFLGDYVDRGYHSVQTILLLFCYKCLYPTKLIMLRGNHQTSSLTRIYGFYDQVLKKYGNTIVWKKVIQAFTFLPLAALIENFVLCIHGGLSPKIPFIDNIQQIQRVKQIPQIGGMCDLVWSDPDANIQGWAVSNRGAGYLFSKQIAKQFLYINGIETISRAHQLVQEGFIYNFGDKSLVTVWSAPNYCYRCGNQACIMKVKQNNQHQFIKFGPADTTKNQRIHYQHLLPYFL